MSEKRLYFIREAKDRKRGISFIPDKKGYCFLTKKVEPKGKMPHADIHFGGESKMTIQKVRQMRYQPCSETEFIRLKIQCLQLLSDYADSLDEENDLPF